MYEIIYTDPPWQQSKGSKKDAVPNSGKPFDYKTIPLTEIGSIHKSYFTQAADYHNVFMWTIDKYLHEAESMMKNNGYKLHARLIWDKCIGIPTAFTVRFAHEYLLWFYKPGYMLKPVPEMRGKYSTVIREQSTVHSKKPEAAYKMIEAMFPSARKIELFARQRREGWEAFGDQLECFSQHFQD